MSVAFVDIKGFTKLTESMPPEDLGFLLSTFRQKVTDCVFSHGGTIDKFIGDAVLIVFGAPIKQEDHAKNVIECALEIQSQLRNWSIERQKSGQPIVEVGIGADTGEVFAGVLGLNSVLEFTVIGDTVNVAERLERITREQEIDIVVSERLLSESLDAQSSWTNLGELRLRGRSGTIAAYGRKTL